MRGKILAAGFLAAFASQAWGQGTLPHVVAVVPYTSGHLAGITSADGLPAVVDADRSSTISGNYIYSGSNTFAEVHGGLPEAVTLTANDYVATAADCGKVKTLPTGTTPTVHLPNLNAGCTITFVTTAAISYQFLAASGGSTSNSQNFTHSRGTNAGDTVIARIVVNSGTAATWNISGDLTS